MVVARDAVDGWAALGVVFGWGTSAAAVLFIVWFLVFLPPS